MNTILVISKCVLQIALIRLNRKLHRDRETLPAVRMDIFNKSPQWPPMTSLLQFPTASLVNMCTNAVTKHISVTYH